MPRAEEACEPPIRYGIPSRSNTSMSVLSGLTVNLLEKFRAELLAREHEKDLAFACLRMPAAESGNHQTARELGMLEDARELLPRRHPPLNLQKHLPRFRAGILRAHNYMIAAGGAGSFGSPAFASGTRTSAHLISPITITPPIYDGTLKNSGSG